MITITREIATRVRDIVAAGLVSGVGTPEPGKLCVEAAVCLALGLPHGDDPGCVNPALRRLKIRLNDAQWPSNAARAAGLRRPAVAQLGSLGAIDTRNFVARVAEMTIRMMVPIALRASTTRNPKHADSLESAAVRCEQEGTIESVRHAARVAANAADAYAAAYAAAADAYAAYVAARVKVLNLFTESVVQILIDMKAPGCEFLDLVPMEAA